MSRDDIDVEVDDGLWERPYLVTGGRTRPSIELDLISAVRSTGQGRVAPGALGREHAMALGLCRTPISVAEVAARPRHPVMVTKVLLSDQIRGQGPHHPTTPTTQRVRRNNSPTPPGSARRPKKAITRLPQPWFPWSEP